MKKPFDPFDPVHLNKRRKRRTKEQMEHDSMLERKRLIEPVKKAIESYNWPPSALTGREILLRAMAYAQTYCWLRNNLNDIMKELGYEKYRSSRDDGRWRIEGKLVTLYRRIGSSDKVFFKELLDDYGVNFNTAMWRRKLGK